MDDSDKTDQNPPLSDGVDDETFARAVGLNNPDPGGTSERKRRTTGVGKRSKAKQERRSKDRTVIRRPPPEVKPVQDSQGSPPEDVTGVVPIIKPAQSATIDVPTSQPVDPQPAQTAISPPDKEITLSDNNLGWLSRRRARVKRTRRTLRHIDPWSVLKVSILLYACLYGATVLAGYLLWTAAVQSGVISNIESFIAEVGSYEVWEINGEEVFRRATVIGAVLFVAGVALNVLLTIIFNLISDLVGGVRVTLLEEDQPPSDIP